MKRSERSDWVVEMGESNYCIVSLFVSLFVSDI